MVTDQRAFTTQIPARDELRLAVAMNGGVSLAVWIGGVATEPFLNQMIALETELSPRALLDAIQAIERDAGRTRGVRWADRTLDIDIVRFGERIIREPGLEIPHPELPNRDFWQRELAELEALT